MTTWNHRLIRTSGTPDHDPDYQVHEVYYGEDGEPTLWTSEPVTFGGADAAEVARELRRAADSIEKHGEFVPSEAK